MSTRFLAVKGALVAVCLSVPADLSATQADPHAAAFWGQPLTPLFAQAARDFDVPEDLLLVLGQVGSGFENRGTAPTIEGGYGVMALRENDLSGDSLALAAMLSGADIEQLKIDPQANIRAAAAVLDRYARDAGVDRSAGDEAWLPAVIRYAGLDEEDSRFFAMGVYELLQAGFSTTNADGETFNVGPRALNSIDLGALVPAGMARLTVAELQAQQAVEGMKQLSWAPAFEIMATPDYPGAIWDPAASCNYSTYVESKDTIVVHTIEGTAAGCRSWFKNCSADVSAHYVVSQTGGVWQMVEERYRAWHAGCYNYRAVGIEHEGYAASSSHPAALYNASALLCRNICDRRGIPKAKRTTGPGIIGHVDVTRCCCGTHTDPGNGWDWTYFINQVNGTPPAPTWAAAYRAQSYPSSMVAGSTAVVWAEFDNTGTGHWKHCETKLGTSSPQDRTSPFCTPANWACANGSSPGCNRPTDVDQSDVANGQVGRFTFILTAPSSPGTYTEKFKLVREGVTWFGPEITWTITVTPAQGNLTGTVRNATTSAVIAGASVTLSGVGSTTTNGSGVYTFNNVNTGTYTVSVSASGFSPASSSVTISTGATATKDFNLTVTDTQAPTTPANLVANATGASTVQLAWTAATDNVGVTGYDIRRNGSIINSSAGTSFTDNTVAPQTIYTYEVRARDAAGNVSAFSAPVTVNSLAAQVVVFSDGFNGNLNNWTQQVQNFDYSTTVNHGTYAGGGAAFVGAGQADQMYRTFSRPFAQGKVSGYFYDGKGGWKPSVCGWQYRQSLSLRETGGTAAFILDNCFASNVGNPDYYWRKLGGGSPTSVYNAYAPRNAGTNCAPAWIYFETTVAPAAVGAATTGTATLKVADGGGTSTTNTDLTTDFFDHGIGRLTLGLGTTSANEGYWDDIAFEATAPNAPTMESPLVVSASQIQWNFAPADNRVFGYEVATTGGTIVSPQYPNTGWVTRGADSWTEGGLLPNMQYTRKVRAWNGTLNSLYSVNVSAHTLSPPPGAGSVTANTTTPCAGQQVSWTAVGGFGTGLVQYYRYAFNQDTAYAFNGTEPQWNSGTLVTTPTSGGTWYLHVQGYNAVDAPNGSYAYPLSVTQPAAPVLESNSPVCAGGTLTLSAAEVAGGIYTWAGPNGFTSNVREPQINSATPEASGDYTVTVTVDGCVSAEASLPVVVENCAVEILAWRSVRDHDGGALAIVLAADASGEGIAGATVETRAGGLQRLEVDFNQPVTIANAEAVSVIGVSTVAGVPQAPVDYSSQAVLSMIDADTLQILFAPGIIPDQTCVAIDLVNAVQSMGGALLSADVTDTACSVRCLVGDVNGNGRVNLGDVLFTRLKLGEPVANLARFDIDGSGDITTEDLAIIKTSVLSAAGVQGCPLPDDEEGEP